MESWLVGGVIHYEIRRKKLRERLINCFRSVKSLTNPMHKYNHRVKMLFIFMKFIFMLYVYIYAVFVNRFIDI